MKAQSKAATTFNWSSRQKKSREQAESITVDVVPESMKVILSKSKIMQLFSVLNALKEVPTTSPHTPKAREIDAPEIEEVTLWRMNKTKIQLTFADGETAVIAFGLKQMEDFEIVIGAWTLLYRGEVQD